MKLDKVNSDSSYYEKIFSKLDLSSLRFSNIEFEECEFQDCDFSAGVFTQCKFLHCSFHRCNLSLVKLPYSQLFAVEFIESKLVGVDWTQADWPSFHLDAELTFNQCVLNDSSFFGLTLNGLVLEECKLRDVDFREGDFSDSRIIYCDLSDSLFMRTNLKGADFTESSNFNINVFDNTLENAKFSRYEALNLLLSLDIELVD